MERMDFKSFCNAVVNGIAEYLLQYEIESIRLETVCHNNGVEHVGLVILLQGDYVSPTIYLEQYYQYMVRQQASLSDVLELVAKEYRRVEDCLQKQEPLTVDLDQMQSRVFLRLVNYERNQETLANCPYIPFHDMAITFRYLVKMDEAGIASALIDYDSMEKSACTVEELYCMAKENTIRLFPPFLMRLDEFLRTRFPQEHVYPEEPERLYPIEPAVYLWCDDAALQGCGRLVCRADGKKCLHRAVECERAVIVSYRCKKRKGNVRKYTAGSQ